MNKISVLLAGSQGRMGLEIQALIPSDPGFSLAGEIQNPPQPSEKWPKADVLVDFSAPEAFEKILRGCLNQKLPFISGTTGLNESHFKLLQEASKDIPVLWSSNMSWGINFIHSLLKSWGKLQGFDFQIEETHHIHKKDAPSGTAISLQKSLQAAVSTSLPEILSIRGGGVFGNHKIWAMAEEEVILLEHQALNRRVFARGALRAATWLAAQGPGNYSMQNVLGLK